MVEVLTTGALEQQTAQGLMDVLEALIEPEAYAVSMSEADDQDGLWIVQAYYEDTPDTAGLKRICQEQTGQDIVVDIQPVPDTNWVEESLKGLAPVRAGRFFVYGQHDRARRPAHGVAIEIDAGVAFGTGHHATTTGCLLALDEILKRFSPQRVLDVGCGTGVLGIAAARSRTARVMMSDIDPQAVATARSNARLNQVAGQVRLVEAAGLSHREIAEEGPYDLIFANILARPLVQLAPAIMNAAQPGGQVVLSGLYCYQERQVFAAYRACGGVMVKRIRQGGWSALWLRKSA